MADSETCLSLQQFIASLDQASLPRILQVCSGVYFQGSIYELSGSEVCLCTGDLVKVINIKLLSVSCEDISTNDKFELPLNHAGLFRLVPEEMAYNTIEEMLSLRPEGLDVCLPFSFTSRCDLTFENFTVAAGNNVTMLSIEQQEWGEVNVRCQLHGQQGTSADVLFPLSCRGEFYECESDHTYTLEEVMTSPYLCSRRFRYSKKTKQGGPLVFSPIYQVEAIMHLRKNIVTFPSTLEVDVVDVTLQSQDVNFVTPLTLPEAFAMSDEAFPTMAEILETYESKPMFCCTWLTELRKGHHLALLNRGSSMVCMASGQKGRKGRQYFLLSQSYSGRLRRRPREFDSVYELRVASIQTPFLKVSVTRNSEELEEEGFPALSVGEQLEVLRCEKVNVPCGETSQAKNNRTVEALVCRRLQEVDSDEDEEDVEVEGESDEIHLPLYMQSHFVEKLTDKKKYSLRDLCEYFTLPLDIKVVSRDAGLEVDPLVGFSSVRLEVVIVEPMIQACLPAKPEMCFEIPTRWLKMSLSFIDDPLPETQQECVLETVTEVTDTFYHEFRMLNVSEEAPPPRPPKRKSSSSSKPAAAGSKPLQGSPTTSRSMSLSLTRPFLPTPSPSDADAPCLPPKSPLLSLKDLHLDSKKPQRPPAPQPMTITDEAPPHHPRKYMAQIKSGRAQPNPYVESNKKGMKYEVQTDVDSDHDYEQVEHMTKSRYRFWF
ncbi:hypothetical protein DPEC_G00349890 [Dallia pectoralis]|uniref:Uncharacterized protein n=1 Tax=Dallia pectoralis TaxID=75939 RepID=A0ACC2F1L5_DALPE|nr:hypothetical protein DPEC_G00349890 [Dallia pectoralis]